MKPQDNDSLSFWVRTLRESSGETQVDFAIRTGISLNSLQNFEYRKCQIGSPRIWLVFWREAARQRQVFASYFREGFLQSIGSNSTELKKLM